MKKSFKISISLMLTFLMLFSIAVPAFANFENSNLALEKIKGLSSAEKQLLEKAIDNPGVTNYSELSSTERELLNKYTENPQLYLADAAVVNNQPVLIYNTADSNIKIASTNGYIEVIEKIDDNTFSINGEEHHITSSYIEESRIKEDTMTMSSYGWVEGSNPGGTWNISTSGWHNIHLENTIGTYTIGALATIISIFVSPIAGVVTGVASMLLGSIYTNSSVAKVYKVSYTHQYPIYKREYFSCYAVYQGSDHYLGYENKYYHRTF